MSVDIKKKRKTTEKSLGAATGTGTATGTGAETDIEKYIEKQIEIKLNSLLETLPDKIPKDIKVKPVYNLTIKELYKNTLQTLIDIITDIVDVYSKKDYVNSNNYIYILLSIFMKDDRKIYVGIMLVVLSFIVYFVDGVSV